MAITVLPVIASFIASWIICSLWLSSALVASSRSRMGASRRIARAIAIRWR
jgi:hypothetical protein